MKKELLEYLSTFITENKNSLFDEALEHRTRYISVVLEDIYQSHNASAVLRSCDCFGVQDIHIIENQNKYDVNPDVALGSSKWVDLYKYNQAEHNTIECINNLKSQGYRVIATTPHKDDCNLQDLDLSKGKIALMFGSELPGLTDVAIEHADEYMKIPMYGFTESLNISVSAAISLQHLSMKLRESDINWQLTEEEKLDIKTRWVKKVIKKPELIEEEFYKRFT